ncbi:atrial natriuretic peptide receptor 2-like [Paramacrobiotus metropolitanus]|uniref:atrial natriuretic peptide receptor 2-like n=1 Tax=Paramacrobiotus metropolitanus TaxID=2943436 RepID=UPI00244582B3|nr:atrial natriuretic peptide receptor 2-like [Paramacrobiotus metropolitanus]
MYALGGMIVWIMRDQKCLFQEPAAEEAVLASIAGCCQSADPADRPEIGHVKQALCKVSGINDKHFMENLVRRLENYSQVLENTVTLRTNALCQERQRCDLILSELLPRQVLVELRKGHPALPKFFGFVSLLFTYVDRFDEFVMSSSSQLTDVIRFLMEMVAAFDVILSRFDCYKVEAVADSYLVASGIPKENDGEHVFIIGRVAERLSKEFSLLSFPSYLNLKIGINSGPCAAGIIGNVRPRYSIFGESVNMASRLGTTSEPGKIQISLTTAEYLWHDPTFQVTERGSVHLKGIGMRCTYWLEGINAEQR